MSVKKQEKWALLELAAIGGLIFVSPAWLWSMPLWIAAMIACLIRGELWEVTDDAEDR